MSVQPTLKIGAVIIRPSDKAVFIIQPKPKREGEVPDYVLPRGTRQYMADNGEWKDAPRDPEGMMHFKNTHRLEPYRRGLIREIGEEAGMTPEQLEKAKIMEIGDRDFASRTKGNYPIHWYVVVPDEETLKTLGTQMPEDALAAHWADIEEIKSMADGGGFSAGYVPVIEEALALVTRSRPDRSRRDGAGPSR